MASGAGVRPGSGFAGVCASTLSVLHLLHIEELLLCTEEVQKPKYIYILMLLSGLYFSIDYSNSFVT